MAITTGQPLQIPADSNSVIASHGAGSNADDKSYNVTLTLRKLTATGTTGVAVFVNGALVNTYTAPS